jgi:hypothetical protein
MLTSTIELPPTFVLVCLLFKEKKRSNNSNIVKSGKRGGRANDPLRTVLSNEVQRNKNYLIIHRKFRYQEDVLIFP